MATDKEQVEALVAENKAIRRALAEERISKLQMEAQLAHLTMASIEMRGPSLMAEMNQAQKDLKDLIDGPTCH